MPDGDSFIDVTIHLFRIYCHVTFSINGIFLTTIHGVWYDTIRDKLTDKDQERSPIVLIQNRSTDVQVTETAAVQLSSEQLAKLSIFRHEDLTPYVRENETRKISYEPCLHYN